MAKLKLDLHDIFSDGGKIEAALAGIVREAEEKRIEEIEIIPGKGSGALKKSVLRFLERPEIRSKYHRIVKDSDNWGRLFVYFRWPERVLPPKAQPKTAEYQCFFCSASNSVSPDSLENGPVTVLCQACGSPNRLAPHEFRGRLQITIDSGY